MRKRNKSRGALLAATSVLVVSGCFFGPCVGEVLLDVAAQEIRAQFGAQVTVRNCRLEEFSSETPDVSELPQNVCCDYETGGGETTSCFTAYALFGILAAWLDPLVLQVPEAVTGASGTWDDGTASGPLDVRATDAFEADEFTTIAAEAGQQFLIFELPREVVRGLPRSSDAETPFQFTLRFDLPATEAAPFDVKPMATVRADVAGQTFYLPQIPCVTDFAQVPAVTIPVPADTAQLTAALSAAFAGVTGCSGAFYDFSGVAYDHDDFLLWKTKSDTKPSATVAVTDALGTRNLDLKKLGMLGMPANTNGARPGALLAADHVDVYQAKASAGQPKEPPLRGVEVANLLGTQTLDLKKADQLFLPAARGDAPVPPLASPNVDAFLCRKAKYAKGSPRLPKGQQALVADAFGSTLYALKKPTRFCLPADVDGNGPGAEEGEIALLCWKAKPAKPRPLGREGVHTTDAQGSQILRTKKPGELCLPSSFLL